MDSRKNDDLDAEIQSHLRMAAQDKLAAGQSPRDARDAALREFGNVGLVKEVTRGMWSWASLESFLQDIRYGLRTLIRTPGFAAVAILTLALGIGANTAIFSVVNGVLLNPLPFRNADRLMVLFHERPNFSEGSVSYLNFLDWQRENHSFEAMAAYGSNPFSITSVGEPENVHGQMISSTFFPIFGINPLLGRNFSADEDRLGANPTLMISEGLWKRKFGSDPEIIGKRLVVNGVGRTIVGVIPAGFRLRIWNFHPGDIYVPIGEFSDPRFRERSWASGQDAVGLLKRGVTLEQARQDMARVNRGLAAAYPDADAGIKARVVPLKEHIVGELRPVLLVLLGAVAFVLLISCVNVANLLLARSNSRQREFAIRIALGAGQHRIVRQLLTESVLLALVGGVLGIILAKWGTAAAIAAVPRSLPRAEGIGLDFHVLLYTFGISVIAGIVFGLAPAWKTSHSQIESTLKKAGRTFAGARGRAQGAFVIAEMALALVLLIGSGLMIRTLFHLWRVDPGFNPHNILTFEISPSPSLTTESPDAIRAAFRQFHATIRSVPGVEVASFDWGAHPMQSDSEQSFWVQGQPKPEHSVDLPMALAYVIEPEYLPVMRIPLKSGRFLNPNDSDHSPFVVVIDEDFAAQYFPGKNPIGQHIVTTRLEEIVGVVGHVNQFGLDQDAVNPLHAQVYESIYQQGGEVMPGIARVADVFVRTRPGIDSASVFPAIHHALNRVDAGMVVFDPENMDQTVADSIAQKRFSMTLLGVFAALALLLASIGIYGVLSYLVGQRTQEIGVRMALGAQRADVLRLIMNDGARMALLGIGVGIVAALGLTHLMTSMLFGVRPTDPLTFGAVTIVLAVIALLACYVPAHRAMRVDPTVALRYE